MKLLKRLAAYPKHYFSMVNMGFGLVDKIKISLWYTWFTLLRNLGKSPTFKKPTPLFLKVCNKPAKLYFWHQLDFDLYHDTFVKEEYGLTLDDNPKIIFDLGGNIGSTVVYFATKYPGAHIYCFEPDPSNIEMLKLNTADFMDRLTIIEKAVWKESSKTLKFYIVPDKHWSSSLLPRSKSDIEIEVKTISLDDAMEEFHIDNIDLLKYDIEGAEYEVFENFKKKTCVYNYVGEIHPKITGLDVAQITRFFPEFRSKYNDPILSLTKNI
jgi:FkbM family methyltransferase